jgi:hypothetical protein
VRALVQLALSVLRERCGLAQDRGDFGLIQRLEGRRGGDRLFEDRRLVDARHDDARRQVHAVVQHIERVDCAGVQDGMIAERFSCR